MIEDYHNLREEQQKRLMAYMEALKSIGYIHEDNLGISGWEAFAYKGKEHLQQHHLYVCPQDSLELKRHLAFRDYLRTHPAAVDEYSKIKVEAADLYPKDIDKYIEYKAPVIENIYSKMQGFWVDMMALHDYTHK